MYVKKSKIAQDSLPVPCSLFPVPCSLAPTTIFNANLLIPDFLILLLKDSLMTVIYNFNQSFILPREDAKLLIANLRQKDIPGDG